MQEVWLFGGRSLVHHFCCVGAFCCHCVVSVSVLLVLCVSLFWCLMEHQMPVLFRHCCSGFPDDDHHVVSFVVAGVVRSVLLFWWHCCCSVVVSDGHHVVSVSFVVRLAGFVWW